MAGKDNGFFKLEIEGDSKIVIDYYNKRINIPHPIRLLMEDIWKLSHDLNIYGCDHVYREANRIADCLAKKGFGIIKSRIWSSTFPKDATNLSFEDYCGSLSNRFCKITDL